MKQLQLTFAWVYCYAMCKVNVPGSVKAAEAGLYWLHEGCNDACKKSFEICSPLKIRFEMSVKLIMYSKIIHKINVASDFVNLTKLVRNLT